MGRRTLLLVVSILIAAVGVALVGLYVKGADDRANLRAEARYGPRPPAPSPTPAPKSTNGHGDLQGYGFTVNVDDADRAIGLLVPGDRVALYKLPKGGGTPQRVVDSVRVVSVGAKKAVKGATEEQVPNTILGLDAPLEDAKAIERAASTGTLVVFVIGANVKASTAIS
jgi:hypothetical protein